MSFKIEHEKWIQQHLKQRQGERRDALKRGHGYGNRLFVEKIWWPLTGHFQNLHPEYEITDSRGRPYYVDLMWILGGNHIIFEIMDYGSHGRDRTKYRMDINRALFLKSRGWQYIEISLDELKENAQFIMGMLQNILSPYLAVAIGQSGDIVHKYSKIERQLMRLAIRHNRQVRPVKAAKELEIHKDTVRKYCRILVDKGKFRAIPSGTTGRVYRYEYLGSTRSHDLI